MKLGIWCLSVLGILATISHPVWGESSELDALITTIRNVQRDGHGNQEVAKAWRRLVESNANTIPTILVALQGAEPLAANWLRSAVDAISERELTHGGTLPQQQLERFIKDTGHDPRARRLAYEWLKRADETVEDRLIPQLIKDPSVEFRRDAVARLMDQSEELLKAEKTDDATKIYRQALDAARDVDQIRSISEKLRSLGEQIDLPTHFGFLMDWKVIGPFDNTGGSGFDAIYPPEKEIDFNTEYRGKEGTVTWQTYATEDEYGMVDVNEPLGKLKETVAYTWTEFTSDKEQDAELRLGCKNAWKVWLNGELLFARNEFHRGMQLDQYRMKAHLRPGVNAILVKICQNEQTETWTVEWQFQLRVCDATGTAILSTTRP